LSDKVGIEIKAAGAPSCCGPAEDEVKEDTGTSCCG